MPEKIGDKEFLTVKEVAEFLKMSVSRVYQLKATCRDFPFHKIGEKLLFEKHEVSAWVMSH